MSHSPIPLFYYISSIVLAFASTGLAEEELDAKDREGQREEKQLKKERAEREYGIERRRDAVDEKFANMKREIGELHRAGRHEEAERLERELATAWERRSGGKRAANPEKEPERVRHLQQAIKHLQMAGLHDQASALAHLSHQIQAEFEARHRDTSKNKGLEADASEGVRELRRQQEQLAGQMQKMAQQLEELRSQVQKRAEYLEKKAAGERE